MSIWGNTINLGLGGGGVPVLTRAEWNALTTEQKQSYGYVGIQDSATEFKRGELVYGADYNNTFNLAEMTPVCSWNDSTNIEYTYNFSGTTAASRTTRYCLAAMTQNGTSKSWSASYPVLDTGTQGNGSYALCCGDFSPGTSASTYSTGNNWNNSEIVCFEFGFYAQLDLLEVFYEQGQAGTYTYTYQAASDEKLLLIAMRGGNSEGAYSVSGLTQLSSVAATGARLNIVYFDEVQEGSTISVSIPSIQIRF